MCLLKRGSHFSYTCDTDILSMFVSLSDINHILDDHLNDKQFLVRRARLRQRKLINFRTRQEIVRRRFYELQDKNPEMLKALAQTNSRLANKSIGLKLPLNGTISESKMPKNSLLLDFNVNSFKQSIWKIY